MGNNTSANGLGASSTADEAARDTNLTGKVAIVTGSNTGIGYETAHTLYKRNAHVILACRDSKKAQEAAQKIKQSKTETGQVTCLALDLSALDSVKQFVADFRALQLPLHLLILNAGLLNPKHLYTKDGFELTMGVCHFGHVSLTLQLLDILAASQPARIVIVSSYAHTMANLDFDDLQFKKRSFHELTVYNQAKLCNLLFMRELDKRLVQDGLQSLEFCLFSLLLVRCLGLHPGVVDTDIPRQSTFANIFATVTKAFLKSVPQGAATSIYCATAKELEGKGSLYFSDCNECPMHAKALNDEHAAKLWQVTEDAIGIKYPTNLKK